MEVDRQQTKACVVKFVVTLWWTIEQEARTYQQTRTVLTESGSAATASAKPWESSRPTESSMGTPMRSDSGCTVSAARCEPWSSHAKMCWMPIDAKKGAMHLAR